MLAPRRRVNLLHELLPPVFVEGIELLVQLESWNELFFSRDYYLTHHLAQRARLFRVIKAIFGNSEHAGLVGISLSVSEPHLQALAHLSQDFLPRSVHDCSFVFFRLHLAPCCFKVDSTQVDC